MRLANSCLAALRGQYGQKTAHYRRIVSLLALAAFIFTLIFNWHIAERRLWLSVAFILFLAVQMPLIAYFVPEQEQLITKAGSLLAKSCNLVLIASGVHLMGAIKHISGATLVRIACLTVVIVSASASSLVGAQAQSTSTEQELRVFIQTMQDAVARRDAPAIALLLAPEFTSVNRDGTLSQSEELLKRLSSGQTRFQKSDSTEQLEEQVVIHGTRAATRTTTVRFQLPTSGRMCA